MAVLLGGAGAGPAVAAPTGSLPGPVAGLLLSDGDGAMMALSFIIGGGVIGAVMLVALKFGAWTSYRMRDRCMRKIAEQFPGIVFQLRRDRDGHLSLPFASGGTRQIFGLAPEDLHQDATPAILQIVPADRAHVVAAVADSARTLRAWTAEFRVRNGSGGEQWIRADGHPEAQAGGVTLWHGVMTNITERRGMEERLRAAEDRWRFALEGSSEGVWDWNPTGGMAFFSPGWKAMLGYSEAEIGDTFAEWETRIHPDDLGTTNAAMRDHLEGRAKTFSSEHRVRCRDGHWRWFISRGKVVERSADGTPTRFIGTMSDVTDRVEIEQSLRSSEAFLRGVFEGNGSAMIVVDVEAGGGFRVAAVNPAYEKLTGISRDFLAGRSIEDMNLALGFDVVERLRARYVQCVSMGDTVEFEELHRLNGRPAWLLTRLTPVGDASGRLYRILGTILDITARKEAEEDHARVLERLQLATQAGRIGLWSYDIASGRLSWDELMYSLHERVSGEAVTEESWVSFVEVEDAVRLAGALRAAFERGGDFEIDYRVVRPGGTVTQLRTVARVQRGTSRQARVVLGACWDTSALQEAREQLAAAKARLEKLNKELNDTQGAVARLAGMQQSAAEVQADVLANMRHEVDAGISRAVKHLGLAEGDGASSISRQRAELIVAELEETIGRIHDVEDLWQLESGRWRLDKKPFEIAESIEAVLDAVAGQAATKRLELIQWIDPVMPPVVIGDSARFRQVMRLLVSNAVRFTAFGEVEVSATCGASASDETLMLRISVRDTGCGMPDEALGRIIKPAGGNEPGARKTLGAGVGMVLCRWLVARLGGSLLAESEVGRGSTFTVVIPCEKVPVATAGPDLAPSPSLFEGRRILVVAINPALGAAIERWLVEWGASVASTSSASAALDMAGSGLAFDVVLIDENANDLPGLARRIADAARSGHRVPLVLVHAGRRASMVDAIPEFVAQVSKPVKPSVLRSTVEMVLRGDAARVAAAPEPATASARSESQGAEASSATSDGDGAFDPSIIEQILPDDQAKASALVARICRQFFDIDGPRHWATLGSTLERRDCTGVASAVHSMAGGLAAVGLVRATEIARRIEAAARGGDLRTVAMHQSELENAMKRGRELVRGWMEKQFPEMVL